MTTTRRYFRNDDIYYDGISWGTPIGCVMFIWSDENLISIFHEDLLVSICETVEEARKVINYKIKEYLQS